MTLAMRAGRDRIEREYHTAVLTPEQAKALASLVASPGFSWAIVAPGPDIMTRPGALSLAWMGTDGRVSVSRIGIDGSTTTHTAGAAGLA